MVHFLSLFFIPFFFGATVQAANRCTPLNSTIALFEETDAIHCPEQMEAAVALGNKKVNILFTANFFLKDDTIGHYCIKGDDSVCRPVTDELLARQRDRWDKCVKAAVDRNLALSIYIQIDDVSPALLWRNNLKFDPLVKYSGYSYDDVLTRPLAEIVKSRANPEKHVEFSLQGEMGATLAYFPEGNLKLLNLTKQRLAGLKDVEVGVNVNYTSVLGSATSISAALLPQLQALITAADFIGISAYHEVMVPVEAENFRFPFEMVVNELTQLGVRVPATKRWRISETGLGGGNMSDDGNTPAKTIAELAAALWSGIRGPYNVKLDPFQKAEFRSFRRDFYREMLAFLAKPPADIPLESAFLWNSDSWDVQGLYPGTRGWQDEQIIQAIRVHNQRCN